MRQACCNLIGKGARHVFCLVCGHAVTCQCGLCCRIAAAPSTLRWRWVRRSSLCKLLRAKHLPRKTRHLIPPNPLHFQWNLDVYYDFAACSIEKTNFHAGNWISYLPVDLHMYHAFSLSPNRLNRGRRVCPFYILSQGIVFWI